ncbi:disulfide bond formation protein B [Sphingomonas sp. G-3-2-10]|uniref:disulfide bond formation protein B n=1 Tax=Sphingomonas sp. G-3-2-10 TaxID=2728838 RepID=UPI00146A171B|nr:disulfide bond formation protein B [Sphingomonas sp. G-3-2-10]NML07932.1 disulfide bond formation protein B [Sphingomonas sp. G-3-2-10]
MSDFGRRDELNTARWIALLLPLGLMAGALGSQYIGGLYPCEMCHWQRWPHYAAILVAALAFAMTQRTARLLLVLIAAVLIAVSGAIGVFHAGVEYHWWNGITACSVPIDPNLSGMDLIESIRRKPLTSCDIPQWKLFNISLAGWNAILSLTGAIAILAFAFRKPRR